MRISDWSSDVYSSDLDQLLIRNADDQIRRGVGPAEKQYIHDAIAQIDRLDLADRARPALHLSAAALDLGQAVGMDHEDRVRGKRSRPARMILVPQIGRASSRERVCQYV